MSYNFGQFRRKQLDSYSTSLSYHVAGIEEVSPLSQAVVFQDKAIDLAGANVLQALNSTGTKARNYFVRFKIYKKQVKNKDGSLNVSASTQIITIKLVNTLKTVDNIQILQTIEIEPGETTDYSTFDIVISPNSTYNQIQFILNRVVEDYETVDRDGIYGRKINLEVDKLEELKNIIDYIDTNGTGQIKQIGVQSAPGFQMCIDGEQIRVGRSGLYEIKNGVIIKFIGFVIDPEDNQHFMLDYLY